MRTTGFGKSGIIVDDRQFRARITAYGKDIVPKAIEKALTKVANEILRDTMTVQPTVPMLEGWLRGSASAFVGTKLVAVSRRGKAGKLALRRFDPKVKEKDRYALSIVFNTPYAKPLHEGRRGKEMHFSTSGSGHKYLQSKLITFRSKYNTMVANGIKRA